MEKEKKGFSDLLTLKSHSRWLSLHSERGSIAQRQIHTLWDHHPACEGLRCKHFRRGKLFEVGASSSTTINRGSETYYWDGIEGVQTSSWRVIVGSHSAICKEAQFRGWLWKGMDLEKLSVQMWASQQRYRPPMGQSNMIECSTMTLVDSQRVYP